MYGHEPQTLSLSVQILNTRNDHLNEYVVKDWLQSEARWYRKPIESSEARRMAVVDLGETITVAITFLDYSINLLTCVVTEGAW